MYMIIVALTLSEGPLDAPTRRSISHRAIAAERKEHLAILPSCPWCHESMY